MIKNETELAMAKEQVNQIIVSNSDTDKVVLQKLQSKIAEYEALVTHNPENPILLELENAEQISDLPIKASIAFKITPQELATICESEEHEYHHDTDYASEFVKVMKILGVQLIDDLFFVAKMSNELKQKLQFLRMGDLDTSVPQPG